MKIIKQMKWLIAFTPLVALFTAVSCTNFTPKVTNVKLVTDGGVVNDHSFNEQGKLALDDIMGGDAGVSYYIEPDGTDSASINIGYESAAETGAKYVLAPGFHHFDAINQWNKNWGYKDLDFLLVDAVVEAPNVASIIFRTELSGFEAGYLTALYENDPSNTHSTHKVGVFGGANFPGVTNFMVGFVEGVKYYDDNLPQPTTGAKDPRHVSFVKFPNHVQYTNSGFAPGKGKANATYLVSKQADVILVVAGPQTADALKAIKDHGSSAKVIGVDTDQKQLYPASKSVFLTSIVKDMRVGYNKVYRKIQGQKESQGIHGLGATTVGDLTNGLTRITTDDQLSIALLYKQATTAAIVQMALKKTQNPDHSPKTWAQALAELERL